MSNRARGVAASILLVMVIVSACVLTAEAPTATPQPTATFVPTLEAELLLTVEPTLDTFVDDPAVIVVPPVTVAVQAAPVQPTIAVVVPVATVAVAVVPADPNAALAAAPTVALLAGCTVRTDWTPYTVVAGDTIGTLAIATNSAVADLATGNCLANADIIYEGQTLYLPRQPIVFTLPTLPVAAGAQTVPSGAAASAPVIGAVLVEPAVTSDGRYLIAPGNVTVRAADVANATSVSFLMSPLNTAQQPVVVGTDANLADGAAVVWRVTGTPLLVNVWAVAVGGDGTSITSNPIIVVNNG